MVSPAGPKFPVESYKEDSTNPKFPSKGKGKDKISADSRFKTETTKPIEQKVSWVQNDGKEIGSIWNRISGKEKPSSEQKALREEILVKASEARMSRLEALANTNHELAMDLVKDCQDGRLDADQAVIILGTIQQHNERVEGIIGRALKPRQKMESYGQLFIELKKLSKKKVQTQSAIDALIRKHAMK